MEEITHKQSEQISGGFTIVLKRNLPERVFIDTKSPRYSGFSKTVSGTLPHGNSSTEIQAFV